MPCFCFWILYKHALSCVFLSITSMRFLMVLGIVLVHLFSLHPGHLYECTQFIHSTSDDFLSCFQFGVITSSTAVHVFIPVFWWVYFCSFVRYKLGGRIIWSKVSECLTEVGTTKQLSELRSHLADSWPKLDMGLFPFRYTGKWVVVSYWSYNLYFPND